MSYWFIAVFLLRCGLNLLNHTMCRGEVKSDFDGFRQKADKPAFVVYFYIPPSVGRLVSVRVVGAFIFPCQLCNQFGDSGRSIGPSVADGAVAVDDNGV